jgi:hypothetical protein
MKEAVLSKQAERKSLFGCTLKGLPLKDFHEIQLPIP